MRVLRDIIPDAVTKHASATRKRVAVIGAGASGICAAKVLKDYGFDVSVFEMGSNIGGMWCYRNDNGLSSAYRTLHINTSKSVTQFSDFPFDDDVQSFPDHVDMHQYLVKYADHFGVTPLIRFNTPVESIEPTTSASSNGNGNGNGDGSDRSPKWQVRTARSGVEVFDSVVVATGHLHVPRHVPQFKDEFQGEYLHSHYYEEPDNYVGKRVCVVGVGNSACDIASDLCVTSKRCVIVARSGVMILPKLIFGKPFTDLSMRLQRPWIPYGVRRRIVQIMTWLIHGDMEQLGFKKPDKRVHTTSNGTIVTDIAYRRITVKQGIERIRGKRLYFADGSDDEFDVLIGATGYKTDLSFLSAGAIEQDDNQITLYQRIVPPASPGLYLLGYFNTDTALNYIFEHQAHWVAAVETGEAVLPVEADMNQAVTERRQWVADVYRGSPRHHLEEESVPYLQALRQSLKAMKQRAKRKTNTAGG